MDGLGESQWCYLHRENWCGELVHGRLMIIRPKYRMLHTLVINWNNYEWTINYCPSMCLVVVWCDCVGGLQWRTDPLPCRGPTLPHPAAGRGAETRETSQCSLCHWDVSVPSIVAIYTHVYNIKVEYYVQCPVYGIGCNSPDHFVLTEDDHIHSLYTLTQFCSDA